MKSQISTVLKFLIGWPLSLLALFFIGKFVLKGLPTITHSITHVDGLLLGMSLLCFLAYFFLRATLWHAILVLKKHSLPFMETTYLWALAEIRRYIPGNIWGILSRTTAFKKKEVAHTTTISSITIEGEYILLGGGVVGIFSLSLLFSQVVHISSPQLLTSIGKIAFFILVFIVLLNKQLAAYVSPKVKKIFQHGLPHFSFFENVMLLSISIAAFFFLGLGTYFGIDAVVPLSLNDLLLYTSFFVLAVIAGYASFIMPMGLGVREGIITAGLTKMFPLSVAGFVALFARLLLILGEVLFVGIVVLWHYFPNKTKEITERYLWQNRHKLFLTVCIALYVIYFTVASFLRYNNFYTGRFDLGNMDQTVWNTAHGRIFQLTDPDGTNIITRLSIHADFLLILLAPFYLIWQDPRMLLLIQTIVLALGSVFVYLLAQDVLKNKTFATVLGTLYLLYPALEHTNLYDFHPVTLATTLFLAAFYFLRKNKLILFVVFLLLAALTKEETWVIAALFGLYAAWFKKKQIIGNAIFAASILIFWYVFFKAIPQAHGGKHFALAYYSDFGSTPSEVIKTIVFSPSKTLSTMFAPEKLEYLKQLLYSLGFLPLIAFPFLVFTIPDLLVNLLSNNPLFHQIYYQYSADLTPFLFIATIFAVEFIRKKTKISLRFLGYFLVIMSLVGAYLYGPLPGERFANVDMFRKQLWYASTIDEFLSNIPPRYSIAATNNLGSHLSHRQRIYTIPNGIDKADVIIFLLNDKNAQPSLPAQRAMAATLTHDPNYIELFQEEDFIAFAKKSLNFQRRLRKEAKVFPFIQRLLPRG